MKSIFAKSISLDNAGRQIRWEVASQDRKCVHSNMIPFAAAMVKPMAMPVPQPAPVLARLMPVNVSHKTVNARQELVLT